jgi:hypothetical protein
MGARRDFERPVTIERCGKDGALLLTPNRLVLLLSLRQAGSFASQKSWAEATLGRTFEFRDAQQTFHLAASSGFRNLLRSIQRLDGTWVHRKREGPGYSCALTARGQAIAEGRVRIRVVGLQENSPGDDWGTRLVPHTDPLPEAAANSRSVQEHS